MSKRAEVGALDLGDNMVASACLNLSFSFVLSCIFWPLGAALPFCPPCLFVIWVSCGAGRAGPAALRQPRRCFRRHLAAICDQLYRGECSWTGIEYEGSCRLIQCTARVWGKHCSRIERLTMVEGHVNEGSTTAKTIFLIPYRLGCWSTYASIKPTTFRADPPAHKERSVG